MTETDSSVITMSDELNSAKISVAMLSLVTVASPVKTNCSSAKMLALPPSVKLRTVQFVRLPPNVPAIYRLNVF